MRFWSQLIVIALALASLAVAGAAMADEPGDDTGMERPVEQLTAAPARTPEVADRIVGAATQGPLQSDRLIEPFLDRIRSLGAIGVATAIGVWVLLEALAIHLVASLVRIETTFGSAFAASVVATMLAIPACDYSIRHLDDWATYAAVAAGFAPTIVAVSLFFDGSRLRKLVTAVLAEVVAAFLVVLAAVMALRWF